MENIDDRPLALRRKRRASSALADPADKEVNRHRLNEETTTHDAPCEQPKTPRNRKKKARFSDSVIEIGTTSLTDLTQAASSSTGLTPALNRTILLPVKSTDKVKKRLSLPERLTTPAPSRSSSGFLSSASPMEIQFAPLSQKINDRTMRRLRRNHLSETTNEIHEANRKSKQTLHQEIESLRNELALTREQRNKTVDTPNPSGVANGSGARIAELESELSDLKQEMREHSTAIESSIPEFINNRSSAPALIQAERSSLSLSIPTETDDFDGTGGQSDDVVDVATTKGCASDHGESPPGATVAEASTQASLPPAGLPEVLRSARLTLEHLFPGETPIGLEVSDPEPLLGAIISRIQSLKNEVDRIEKEFSVKETSRINMGRNFDSALRQLESHRTQITVIKARIDEEKNRTRTAELEISTLEARLENVESKQSGLKRQRDDDQRSIERLQDALKHYRNEAEKLTSTVLRMESSHEADIAKLRSEYQASNAAALIARDVIHDETVSDLEAQVDAQKIGRLKAEESAVERLSRIKELENRQSELKSIVNQKQAIIRQLEAQIEQNKSGHDDELGQLNVRIGELVSNISSVNAELATARQESSRLSKLVEQEKAAGLKAVETMQSRMKKCSNEVEDVKNDHAEGVKKRGEAVAQSFGLITPIVEGGRFRDAEADEKVEGHVELKRGKATKKRPDSGVALWGSAIEEEEDGDGDVVMEDPEVATAMDNQNDLWGTLDELM
ncbi:MAG: hypothetical protein Q9178_005524 [Gyalolechia marmorata]